MFDLNLVPYLLLFAVFAVPAMKQVIAPSPSSQLWFLLAGLLLIVVIGLRYEIGADWWTYVYLIRYVEVASFMQGLRKAEPAYSLLNMAAAQMHWGLWFPDLVCATIFTYGLLKFCRDQSNASLALAVSVPYLVIGVAMGYTRQSAALGFIFLAIHLYGQGKIVKMLICLVLATTFHTSAIVMVGVLGLATVRKGFLIAVILLFMGGFLAYEFLGTIQLLLTRYSAARYTAGGALPRLLMNILPAMIFLSMRKRLATNESELRLWTVFSLLAFFSALLLLMVRSSTIVDRFGIYLGPLQVFVLSRLPAALGTRLRPNALVAAGILLYSLAVEVVWLTFGRWGDAWLPYSSYLWQPGKDQGPPLWYRQVIRGLP